MSDRTAEQYCECDGSKVIRVVRGTRDGSACERCGKPIVPLASKELLVAKSIRPMDHSHTVHELTFTRGVSLEEMNAIFRWLNYFLVKGPAVESPATTSKKWLQGLRDAVAGGYGYHLQDFEARALLAEIDSSSETAAPASNEHADQIIAAMWEMLNRKPPQYCNEIRLPAGAATALLNEIERLKREQADDADRMERAAETIERLNDELNRRVGLSPETEAGYSTNSGVGSCSKHIGAVFNAANGCPDCRSEKAVETPARPDSGLLMQAHVLICQQVGLNNRRVLETNVEREVADGMRQWLVSFADGAPEKANACQHNRMGAQCTLRWLHRTVSGIDVYRCTGCPETFEFAGSVAEKTSANQDKAATPTDVPVVRGIAADVNDERDMTKRVCKVVDCDKFCLPESTTCADHQPDPRQGGQS